MFDAPVFTKLPSSSRNTIIVAFDDNRLIGNGQSIPWHFHWDMKWFRGNTMDHAVLMGRNTFESLGKPLPGRENVVVSKTLNPKGMPDGSIAVPDLNVAIELAHLAKDKLDVFIIGGAQIYQACLEQNLVDRMLITHVRGTYEGNIFFPEFNEDEWYVSTLIQCSEDLTLTITDENWESGGLREGDVFCIKEYIRKK